MLAKQKVQSILKELKFPRDLNFAFLKEFAGESSRLWNGKAFFHPIPWGCTHFTVPGDLWTLGLWNFLEASVFLLSLSVTCLTLSAQDGHHTTTIHNWWPFCAMIAPKPWALTAAIVFSSSCGKFWSSWGNGPGFRAAECLLEVQESSNWSRAGMRNYFCTISYQARKHPAAWMLKV